jgi:hypothetical protein
MTQITKEMISKDLEGKIPKKGDVLLLKESVAQKELVNTIDKRLIKKKAKEANKDFSQIMELIFASTALTNLGGVFLEMPLEYFMALDIAYAIVLPILTYMCYKSYKISYKAFEKKYENSTF